MKRSVTALRLFTLFALITMVGTIHAQNKIHVHDPVVTQSNGKYYLYCTGRKISQFVSSDLQNWERRWPVFKEAPQWAVDEVPGFRDHIWAPDIIKKDSTFYLFYSISTFGKNRSCIGVATNKNLDPDSEDYNWVDHGKVIESNPGRDNWNAIDPNIIQDDEGTYWMAFGSFWDGLKLVKMSDDLLSIAQPQEWHSIARRPRDFDQKERDPGNGAIEAPFIVKRGNYYYLFASFDLCCRGEKSTYKVVVGRSNDVTGPYLDKDGISMQQGGGTIFAQGDENWYGVGHNSFYNFDGQDYIFYHGYDAHQNGAPVLRINKVSWQNDWPVLGENIY